LQIIDGALYNFYRVFKLTKAMIAGQTQ